MLIIYQTKALFLLGFHIGFTRRNQGFTKEKSILGKVHLIDQLDRPSKWIICGLPKTLYKRMRGISDILRQHRRHIIAVYETNNEGYVDLTDQVNLFQWGQTWVSIVKSHWFYLYMFIKISFVINTPSRGPLILRCEAELNHFFSDQFFSDPHFERMKKTFEDLKILYL